MRTLLVAGLLLGFTQGTFIPILAQDPAPPSQQQEQQPAAQPPGQGTVQTPAAPPAKPPREVGKPQTPEEATAWAAIERAQALPEKARLAESFLSQFPESGLTPYAHQVLAFHYQQANDYEKFVFHSEKTLEELPNNPLILVSLAGAYAQKGEADKAIERAQKGLRTAEGLNRPASAAPSEWAMQIDQLLADAHYAIGTASLAKHQAAPAPKGQDDADLNLAIAELEKAVNLDPVHERAYLQLGFAYVRKEQGEKAMESFARAAAPGAAIQAMAREQLVRLHQFVYKNADGVDQAVAQEKANIERRLGEKQAFYKTLDPPPATPAPPPPASTPPSQP